MECANLKVLDDALDNMGAAVTAILHPTNKLAGHSFAEKLEAEIDAAVNAVQIGTDNCPFRHKRNQMACELRILLRHLENT